MLISTICGNMVSVMICGIIGVFGYGTYGNDNIQVNFLDSLT